MKELDHLLTLDTSGIKEYQGELKSKAAQLREWLDTPEGQVYGLPGWGNPLAQFKHDPLSDSNVQAAMESVIFQKLSTDLPSLKTTGIRVTALSFDLIKVTINIPEGEINEEVAI